MKNANDGEKNDRRVIKTIRSIKKAFIKLLSEKDINEITMKNVADEADIDRKTLYNYYDGIYELSEELENNFIETLEETSKKLDFKNDIKNPQRIYELLTENFNSNIDLYRSMLKMNNNFQITAKIAYFLKNKLLSVLEDMVCKEKNTIDVLSSFITAGLISVYQNWFNSENKQPIDTISVEAGKFILYGLKAFSQNA